MCVNWNVLQYLCAIVELQPVATRLPGVRLPLDNLQKKFWDQQGLEPKTF